MQLTSLLPGLRDLRAPLAAGFLWLAVGWLLWSGDLPSDASETKGLLADIYALADDVGRVGVLSAVVFVAYIVGVLASGRLRGLVVLPITLGRDAVAALLSSHTVARLVNTTMLTRATGWLGININRRVGVVFDKAYAITLDSLDRRYRDSESFRETVASRLAHLHDDQVQAICEDLARLRRWRWPIPPGARIDRAQLVSEAATNEYARRALLEGLILVPLHASEVMSELGLIPQRIVETMTRTFDRYDQLRSEAEFRQAVGTPLMILPLALAGRTELSYLVIGGLNSSSSQSCRATPIYRSHFIGSRQVHSRGPLDPLSGGGTSSAMAGHGRTLRKPSHSLDASAFLKCQASPRSLCASRPSAPPPVVLRTGGHPVRRGFLGLPDRQILSCPLLPYSYQQPVDPKV
jgi:hypothetical protein